MINSQLSGKTRKTIFLLSGLDFFVNVIDIVVRVKLLKFWFLVVCIYKRIESRSFTTSLSKKDIHSKKKHCLNYLIEN